MYDVWYVVVCRVWTSYSLPRIVQSVRRKRRTQLNSTPAVDILTLLSCKGPRLERQVAHQVEGMCDREGKQGHALITLWQWRSLILIHSHTKCENLTKVEVNMEGGRTHVISETRNIDHVVLSLPVWRCPDLSVYRQLTIILLQLHKLKWNTELHQKNLKLFFRNSLNDQNFFFTLYGWLFVIYEAPW